MLRQFLVGVGVSALQHHDPSAGDGGNSPGDAERECQRDTMMHISRVAAVG